MSPLTCRVSSENLHESLWVGGGVLAFAACGHNLAIEFGMKLKIKEKGGDLGFVPQSLAALQMRLVLLKWSPSLMACCFTLLAS